MPLRKIGFFVSDKRHFDYFKNVFDAMYKSEVPFDMIINDTRNEANASISDEYNRSMLEIAQQMGFPFRLLSEVVLQPMKYPYVVTTYSFKYTIRTEVPKVPERIIRFIVKAIIKLSALIRLQTIQRRIYDLLSDYEKQFRVSPERSIAEKVILFPKGLDLKMNKYPDPAIISEVDEYFCHGHIDADLIRLKTGKMATIIGYPRYDTLNSHREKLINDLTQEFQLDRSKKLISWIPTYVPREGNPDFNIDNWLPFIQPLLDDYEIIVRPHPKRIERNANELLDRFKKLGFHIDILAERDMNQLYAASDFIFCDYGGVVFSSIYTDSNLLMLNHANHEEEHDLQKHLLVYQVREKLLNINIMEVEKNPGSIKNLLHNSSVWDEQYKQRSELRKDCFGGIEAGKGSILAAAKLRELLEKI